MLCENTGIYGFFGPSWFGSDYYGSPVVADKKKENFSEEILIWTLVSVDL